MAKLADTPEVAAFPLRIERAVFSSPEGERVVEVARFDQSKATEDFIANCCGNEEHNLKAVNARAVHRVTSPRDWDSAVYIIEPRSRKASKIGITRAPRLRLESLQNGSYEPLRYTHLFWMPHTAAHGIEAMALRVMARMGKRLTGEWVDAPSDEAALTVATLLKCSTVSFSDSAMLCQNLRNAYRTVGSVERGFARVSPEDLLAEKFSIGG